MSKKLLIFDIDGTLCEINQPISLELSEILQNLSKKHTIVLASGKPFGYIAGFARQLGLSEAMVIGENGGTLMYDAKFPPIDYYQFNTSNEVKKIFENIKDEFEKEFKSKIWFQPNAVNLTIFPIDINDINKIHLKAKEFEDGKITTYYHKDSVDFVPKGFDKGSAIDVLLNKFPFEKKDIYIFGDGSNDIPMFEKGDNIITIGNFELFKDFDSIKLNNISELTNYLKEAKESTINKHL